jgi:SM-20-related protein
MDKQFDLLIDSYLENKVGIARGFLNERLAKGLGENIIQLQKDEAMTGAGIGNEEMKDRNQKTRTDKIFWLDKSHNNIYEQEFLSLAENLIEYLNRTCYSGINNYEFHYALYDKGSFYKRHTDQFKTNNNRKFSLINYLNEDWLEEDGGQLYVYPVIRFRKFYHNQKKQCFLKVTK